MPFTPANVIREHAQTRPDHLALVFGDRRLTFAALHERSSRAANALRAAGVGPGDRVALLMRNSPDFYVLALACSKLDATVVMLNWRLAPAELAAIVADAEPALLIADEATAALAPANAITLGDAFERRLAAAAPDDPGVPSAPDSVFLVLYTSGTTGLPKGITITNENFSWIPRLGRELYRMTPDSVYLMASPLFHIGGAGTGMCVLTLGGTTVVLQASRPAEILATIERERATHAFFVPTVIQSLVESPEVARRDLSRFEIMIYGGAPITGALLRRAMRALGCGFVGCYGMTEATSTVAALTPEEHVVGSPALHSVGRPLPWVELKIADPDTGEELPPGAIGEIWVRAEQVAKGYWRRPESAALVCGGWFRTGDGARRDAEGYIYLQDRIKDMIISGGENIYPAEVENVLADHPAVAQVAVIGVPHPRWGETPKAIVVARPGCAVTGEELIEFARTRLARYKCPTSVDLTDDLPRTASGKVLKQPLRERYAAHPVRPR